MNRLLPLIVPVFIVTTASVVAFTVTWAYGTTEAAPAPALDTTTVVEITPPPTPEPTPEPTVVVEPAIVTTTHIPAAAKARHEDPIDYSRLNTDVRVVADTLERFNQKLLRMIAQARAEQIRAEAAALGTPPVMPEPEPEVEEQDEDDTPEPVAIPAAATDDVPNESEPTL